MRKMRMPIFPQKMTLSDTFWTYDNDELEEMREKMKKNLEEMLYKKYQKQEDDIIDALRGTCEVIDLAEKEMEDIDTTEIDHKYNSIMIPELIHKMIRLWTEDGEQLNKDDTQFLYRALNSTEIVYKERYIMLKLKKYMTATDFSNKTNLPKNSIIPIPKDFNKGLILILLDDLKKPQTSYNYDEEDLVEKLIELGQEGTCKERELESYLDYMIRNRLYDKLDEIDTDTYIRCNIEDKVLAIGINQSITDPKEKVAEALKINPDLFIKVCGPMSTILLIDARRWVLEEEFEGDDGIWYQ